MTTTFVQLPPLASAAQLAEFIEQPVNAAAELMLAAATSTIRRYCGWHIAPVLRGHEFIVDASGGKLLALPTLRIVELTALSIKQSGSAEWVDATADELAALDYSAGSGWVRWSRSWPSRARSVRVTMSHGFEHAPEVQQVALTMAARAIAAPFGAVSQTTGAVSMNFGAGGEGGPGGGVRLWPDQMQMLDRFRLFGRA